MIRVESIPFMFIIIFFIISCQPEETHQEKKERRVPVEVMVLKKGDLEESINLTGLLKPIHSVDVVSEVSGKVMRINKELGNYVSPNDILALIDDKIALSNYKQAKAQLLSAGNNLKIANLNLKSDKELLENGDISDLAYENTALSVKSAEANKLSAEATLSALEKTYWDTRIKSPIRGQISRKYIELGSMVTPGTPLYHVVDLSTLKLEVGVSQDIIGRIHPGMTANVEISSIQNTVLNGTVKHISPQAETNSGSFMTEIHIPNDGDKRIFAGMTAKVNLRINNMGSHLTVPDIALTFREEKPFVYRIQNNIAKLTPVEVLQEIGVNNVIGSGLAEGDSVVIVGLQNLGIDTKVWIEHIH